MRWALVQGLRVVYERHKIKERTVKNRKKAIRNGGRPIPPPPLGWCWNAGTGSFVEEEVEARTVREAFRLLANEGLFGGTTVRKLKANGFQSREQKKTGERKYIVPRTLPRIIRRTDYYTGLWVAHCHAMPDIVYKVPPLVDEETFRLANINLDRSQAMPDRATHYPFLLKGLVVCAGCGHKMRAQFDDRRAPLLPMP